MVPMPRPLQSRETELKISRQRSTNKPQRRNSKSVQWFWNLTETSHRISFLTILTGCLVLFVLNLHFIIYSAPGFFHETTLAKSDALDEVMGQRQENRLAGIIRDNDKNVAHSQQRLSLRSRNLLNLLLMCASILHFIVLTAGLIGLVRNHYQWILGFIVSWTILFVAVDLIIYSVTGRFYLQISSVLIFILFAIATVVHVILITYPQSDDLSTGYAYAV